MIRYKIDNLDGNLEIGRKYRIVKTEKSKAYEREYTVKLIKKYKNYYLFYDYRGFMTCFLKVDFITGDYLIKEMKL